MKVLAHGLSQEIAVISLHEVVYNDSSGFFHFSVAERLANGRYAALSRSAQRPKGAPLSDVKHLCFQATQRLNNLVLRQVAFVALIVEPLPQRFF